MFTRRPQVPVNVQPSGDSYPCALDESLLRGMLKLGRRGIPAGCVSGGCGVCKVRIVSGDTKKLGPISRAHVTEEEEAQGYTLACRVAPLNAITLEVSALLRKPFSRPAIAPAQSTSGIRAGQADAAPPSFQGDSK